MIKKYFHEVHANIGLKNVSDNVQDRFMLVVTFVRFTACCKATGDSFKVNNSLAYAFSVAMAFNQRKLHCSVLCLDEVCFLCAFTIKL